MKFIADLHIHSKFSIATAKDLNLENIHISAQKKGITVVGTGDCTHPGWVAEIEEKLVPAEQGLFKLRDDISKEVDEFVPKPCRGKVRFILASEISTIYKKKEKTRKNHNLVFHPDVETAKEFNKKLDKIGNIKSDGRPILGLDSKNLLEILLETSDESFMIPAHVWTPWFSVLGSKSGFDSIEECFEDLTPYIFAIETGLSSDPAMNWRVSSLDGFTLVSNSDAHSPAKLGREANLFNTELTHSAIKSALKTGNPEQFLGTLEFFPEEGKYHFDGHRNCNVCFSPEQTKKENTNCPVCSKPLTLGVMYRVDELADRPEGKMPENRHPFHSIIPLAEILSEIYNVGAGSKKIKKKYQEVLDELGPELDILFKTDIGVIEKANTPLLGEAISRMRSGEIELTPGYDGEFGKTKIFRPQEIDKLCGQKFLFSSFSETVGKTKKQKNKKRKKTSEKKTTKEPQTKPLLQLNETDAQLNNEQQRVLSHENGPLLIVAGPGTGKTHTITHRIAHIIKEKGVSPETILSITFTNRAAKEMEERLKKLLPANNKMPLVCTFHSFCYRILAEQRKKERDAQSAIIDDNDRKRLISDVISHINKKEEPTDLKNVELLDYIVKAKQQLIQPDDATDDFKISYETYEMLLSTQGLLDYEDLIFHVIRLFESNTGTLTVYKDRYKHIFVDEYQDLNLGQYNLIRALAPQESNLCVIGDPDQSIYGFRGSDSRYFSKFVEDYPDCEVINLQQNYRSTETILQSSHQIIKTNHTSLTGARIYSNIDGVKTISIKELANEKVEAETVGKIIQQMIGGTGFHDIDLKRVKDANSMEERVYSDAAVLYRTNDQARLIGDVFDAMGIPYQIARKESFLKSKSVSALISLLQVVHGTGSYIDFERATGVLNKSLGKSLVRKFKTWGYEKGFSLDSAISNAKRFPIKEMDRTNQSKLNDTISDFSDLKKRIEGLSVKEVFGFLVENTKLTRIIKDDDKENEAIYSLLAFSLKFNNNFEDFKSAAALQTDPDSFEHHVEKVSLMTMHASKGLEFNVVFIVGCEDGYIPFMKNESEQIDINEERRLFYVAMTRAREQLFLTYTKKRKIYGKSMMRKPSPFLNDIGEKLKEFGKIEKKKAKGGQVQLDLFQN